MLNRTMFMIFNPGSDGVTLRAHRFVIHTRAPKWFSSSEVRLLPPNPYKMAVTPTPTPIQNPTPNCNSSLCSFNPRRSILILAPQTLYQFGHPYSVSLIARLWKIESCLPISCGRHIFTSTYEQRPFPPLFFRH